MIKVSIDKTQPAFVPFTVQIHIEDAKNLQDIKTMLCMAMSKTLPGSILPDSVTETANRILNVIEARY